MCTLLGRPLHLSLCLACMPAFFIQRYSLYESRLLYNRSNGDCILLLAVHRTVVLLDLSLLYYQLFCSFCCYSLSRAVDLLVAVAALFMVTA